MATLDEQDNYSVPVPLTRLSGKEYSPLIIRRYALPVLHWVALITDDDLSNLDVLVSAFWRKEPLSFGIQDWRNLAGQLSKDLQSQYPRLEGLAVIISADKLLISSLLGDFMVHGQCRLELYSLLNLSTQV